MMSGMTATNTDPSMPAGEDPIDGAALARVFPAADKLPREQFEIDATVNRWSERNPEDAGNPAVLLAAALCARALQLAGPLDHQTASLRLATRHGFLAKDAPDDAPERTLIFAIPIFDAVLELFAQREGEGEEPIAPMLEKLRQFAVFYADSTFDLRYYDTIPEVGAEQLGIDAKHRQQVLVFLRALTAAHWALLCSTRPGEVTRSSPKTDRSGPTAPTRLRRCLTAGPPSRLPTNRRASCVGRRLSGQLGQSPVARFAASSPAAPAR